MSAILIAFAASVGWAVKDAIKDRTLKTVESGWLKYLSCFAGGAAFAYMAGWKFFQQVSIAGFVVLVGSFFDEIKTFVVWGYNKIRGK